MAFQKFKMKKNADWSKRQRDKSNDLWRKRQRGNKAARRSA